MSKDNIQKLRKENGELKLQINELSQEMEGLKNKIASLPAPSNKDTEIIKSLDFMSEGFDDMKSSQFSVEKEFKSLSAKLERLSKRVYSIDGAIEDHV